MFTTGEVRQAWTRARSDGHDIPTGPDDPATVGTLARLGYLHDLRLAHLLPEPQPLRTRGHRVGPLVAARRARSARHHRMRPHRTIVIRSA